MAWRDLAFFHWRVDPARVAAHLPPGLEVDLYRGEAWLGVVPFRMANARLRGIPASPPFLELNLRTYVAADGVPGVWFFSLDAGSPSAVRAARAVLHLPYFNADIERREEGGWIHDRSVRIHRGEAQAQFAGTFRPVGPAFKAAVDSLEHWLTERYFLYALTPSGRLTRGAVAHVPWPLRDALGHVDQCSLGEPFGLPLEGSPLVHASVGVAVRAWMPQTVRLPRPGGQFSASPPL